MKRARGSDHLHNESEGAATVAAGILGLEPAFVEFVRASVGATRMVDTRGGNELAHVMKLVSAVFAITSCHGILFFLFLLHTIKVRTFVTMTLIDTAKRLYTHCKQKVRTYRRLRTIAYLLWVS